MNPSHQPTLPQRETDPTVPWASGRLGRYERVRELARGGMGVVLQGYDRDADREVAIKVVAFGLADVASVRERFVAEARMTARLEHPGIVPVYEVGQLDRGELFFAMKLVRGSPLTARLAAHSLAKGTEQRRSLLELLEVLRKVCDACAYAHDQGAVHRDLKPDNVLLGSFGEVYVCDWGLVHTARDAAAGARAPSTVDPVPRAADPSLTLDGDILGTPGYMSPEQARGDAKAIGAATDVYALGAILYHLLTGVAPHAGDTISGMIEHAARGELVPPSVRAPGRAIPHELEAACLRAMAKDPVRRYADAAGLRADLEAFLAGRELVAVHYSAPERMVRWARRHPLLLAVVCGSALGWGALAHQRRSDRDVAVARLVDEARDLVERAAGPAATKDPAARQRALEDLVAAASALDHARRLDPESPELAHQRRAAGAALGALALDTGELGLARQAYRQLAHHGATSEEVERLELEVARASDRFLDRANEILADVRAGLDRPGRRPDDPRLDDYVFELAAARDPRVGRALGDALSDALAERASRETGVLAARALARLGLQGVEGAVAALDGALAAAPRPTPRGTDADPETLLVEVGLALCATRDSGAFAPLARLLDLLGPNSRAWRQVAPFVRRIPPPNDASVLRLEATQGRVLLYLAQGADERAMAQLDHYLAAPLTNVQRASLLVNRALVWSARGEAMRARDDLDGAVALLDAEPAAPVATNALATALGNRAAVAIGLGEVERALADLERALALVPSVEHYANLASARLRQGRNDEALAALDRAAALDPARPEVHDARARVLLDLGQLGPARAAVDRAIELAPRASGPLVVRALIRATGGAMDEAMVDLDRAVSLALGDQELATALAGRARLHLNAARLEAAAADLARARARSPRDAGVREMSAALDLKLGRLEAGRAEIASLIAEGGSGPTLLLLAAMLAEHEGAFERVRAIADRALAASPRMAEALDLRVRASYALGDVGQAERDLDRAIALAPLSARLQERARLRHRAGRFADARADVDQALAVSRDAPERARIHQYRIQLDLLLADTQAAVADLARARDLAPDDPALPLYEAHLALAGGDVASAVARLDGMRAGDLAPALRLMRAQAYAAAGRLEAAMTELDAIAETPDPAVRSVVRAQLAKVAIQARDLPRAARALDTHLGAYPADVDARVDRAQVRAAAADLDGALADLDHVLGRDGAHPQALAVRAALFRQRGDLARALADHEASLVRGGGLWNVQASYGYTLPQAGRTAEAREVLTRAHALAPAVSRPTIEALIAGLPK